jgi:arylsulfatase A-like enzyme
MMYAEQLHAPLIVRWSGARAGVRQSAFVQPVDLYPTLLEAHGVEPPYSAGIGLTAMLQGRSDRERWYSSSSTDGAQAFETHLAKLIRQPAGPSEFYLKPEDRWDLNNVASRSIEQVEQMERTLQSIGKGG